MSYIQKTVGVKETFRHGSVALVSLSLLSVSSIALRFEHTNPASLRSCTHASDRAATGDEESLCLNILRSCGIRRKILIQLLIIIRERIIRLRITRAQSLVVND